MNKEMDGKITAGHFFPYWERQYGELFSALITKISFGNSTKLGKILSVPVL
jgi:hypothetical protein